MEGFGDLRPEVPLHGVVFSVGLGVAFLGMDEVGELDGVANEECGGVVSDQIPVAFFGVELEGKPADVADGVGGAFFAGDGGEAAEHFGFFADLGEDLCLCVWGDVVCNGECAEGAGGLGVDDAFGDALTVEVGELFQQVVVLQEGGAAFACGQGGLVVRDGDAGGGGQCFGLIHFFSPIPEKGSD